MNYQEYIIEGNPGAGKSTILGKMVDSLRGAGVRVDLAAPFRIVKDELKQTRPGEDPLYDIWQSKDITAAKMALRLLRESVLESRQQIAQVESDGNAVLLFDRGWLTLLRALEDMGVTTNEIEAEKEFWRSPPVADTFFITTPPAVSLEANKRRDLRADWRSAGLVLEDDYTRRRALIEQERSRVIEVFEVTHLEQDRSPMARNIEEYILRGGTRPQQTL